MAEIRAVLLREWDPIAVKDIEQAQDEYEGYVGGVYELLLSDASPDQVAEHLCTVERTVMGFKHTQVHDLLPVAKRLCMLKVRLNDSDDAS